jgi:serine protease Do
MNHNTRCSLIRCFVIGGVSLGAASMPALADKPVEIDASSLAHAEALGNVFRAVADRVDPTVVKINTVRTPQARGTPPNTGGGMRDMLRRFFPDNDGDGQPDLPEGFNFDLNTPPGPPPPQRGEGSGVIMEVEGDKAFILTNNHVAGDASQLLIELHDGRRIDHARVIGTDPNTDLAVVEITVDNVVSAEWGDSDDLRRGDIVLAFGSPFGYGGSMSQGIVSALNRQSGLLGQFGYEYWIQTDAAINPGNSGGPLVNLRGEVIGINTAIASRTGAFNGIGFSIPSNQARFVYDQLRTSGTIVRGWLGVQIADVTAPNVPLSMIGYTERRGVYVQGILRGAPAEGQLMPDDVITHIDGKVVSDAQQLRTTVARTKPGDSIKLTVWREGKTQDVSVTLGTLPEERQPVAAAVPSTEATAHGAKLTDLTSQQRQELGLARSVEGALVTEVQAGSAASELGLESGQVIIRVNNRPVKNAAEAVEALTEADLKQGVRVIVVDSEGTRALSLQRR